MYAVLEQHVRSPSAQLRNPIVKMPHVVAVAKSLIMNPRQPIEGHPLQAIND